MPRLYCRGRIYPSRGTHARQFGEGNRPLTQSEVISGRINPSPTSTLRQVHEVGMFKLNTDLTDLTDFHGDLILWRHFTGLRDLQGFCRGRIYPSRGRHACQFGEGNRPLTQSEVISGRINPSPTSTLRQTYEVGMFKLNTDLT
ncbi:MAG: hypothetical protein FWG87_04605 [Defluviitaleaceae bacterium]|nr:hypothetical protein [Defluviitaleaceae bacterium]